MNLTSYIGQGAVRFYLSLDPQPANPFYAQLVVDTKDLKARARVEAKLRAITTDKFVGADLYVHTLELGPPVGRPIQYRLSGPDTQQVRQQALALANVVGQNPHLDVLTFDWNEPGKVLRVDVVQDKARQLGITSQDLAGLFNNITGGSIVTTINDSIYIVPIVARAEKQEREALDTFSRLQVPLSNGSVVPLLAFASLHSEVEQPIVWRRDRVPTITVRATIRDDTQAPTVVAALAPAVQDFARKLPPDYKVEVGGTVEESGKGQGPIVAVVPVMLLVMAFVLMVQLQSMQKLFIVASVAPLGLIGVMVALLTSGQPLGFVAVLGILALIGIIIRNSVILVVQIDENVRAGHAPWDAVVEATCHRMRPILLTASAASLAMIPIASELFWGPMAFAMIGGILAGTLLTLFFLPALYVGWLKVRGPDSMSRSADDHAGVHSLAVR